MERFWRNVGWYLFGVVLGILIIGSLKAEEVADPGVKVCAESSCTKGHGSGVYLWDNYFLTAGHVTTSRKKMFIRSSANVIYSADVVWTANNSDFGLLRTNTDAEKMLKVESNILNCNGATRGQKIYNYANPESMVFLYMEGMISSNVQKKLGNWSDVYAMDLTGWEGSSGSPVFNEDGEVIGILVASLGRVAYTLLEPVSKVCDFLPTKTGTKSNNILSRIEEVKENNAEIIEARQPR